MEINEKMFKVAYKKLKSSLYYDKTQSIVRDELVRFEAGLDNIDEYLEQLSVAFLCKETREKLINDILGSISYYAFPKNYVFPKKLLEKKPKLIKNYTGDDIEVEDNQYFIDMDIKGHILGVLWLILIGYRVDEAMYKHSYGNRIRRNLYNELSESPTYSPYLFEPYFQQYESWRDTAMDEAMNHLNAGQDVVVLTLDFRRFYYSVDVTENFRDGIYSEAILPEEDCEELRALNSFIFKVIKKYAKQVEEFGGLNVLPIGFLPSNVLANYALRNFDKAILDGWNPIYFGRYVDDVIIVDKIESNSDLFNKAKTDNLEASDVMTFFLEQCSGWKGMNGIKCRNSKQYALFCHNVEKTGEDDSNDDSEYVLNKLYNPTENDGSRIVVKNEKVKIFYFKSGQSDSLITCFKEAISKNKSEFRHMPEDEAVFQKDDYSKIYDLENDETINKFRGISGIAVDKYELSKLLGKYLRIGGMINDVRETGFEEQIKKIFSPRVIVENYNVWEKIIEILVINESWDVLKAVVEDIFYSIDLLRYRNKSILSVIQKTMREYLQAAVCRAMALVWGDVANEFIRSFCGLIATSGSKKLETRFRRQRKAYCKTRMLDKSVMPIFVDMLNMKDIYKSTETVSLCDFNQMMPFCKTEWKNGYYYYPYLVTMYDFSMIMCIEQLKKEDGTEFAELNDLYKNQVEQYVVSNYRVDENVSEMKKIIQVSRLVTETVSDKDAYLVSVKSEKKERLKIAVANVRLRHDNFKNVVIDRPNRSYDRYRELSKIINEAINEKVDMLIMPESYLPFEWLSTVARTCARNNLAVVTGIEHIKVGEKVFNLTATILPYDDLINKSALISFHLKVHYAPAEKQEINGYRLKEVPGNYYELYKWHECYFPVYCCYELTSIVERAMFQSFADYLVAIEWNKDINYYSNILESLSRDIHCYCIQVNFSDYGDSRITKPSRTEEKDIMRTKGGINSTILVDEIDITKIREFQLKGYDLQAQDKRFKPTPPGFNPEIVKKKIKGEDIMK